jgi:fatty-acyl-CoA synthase
MLTPAGYRGQGVIPNFWKLVERFGATSFSGVPTIYAALADLPRDGADIASLRFAFCGAAPLPAEVARRFEAATGISLYEGYGLTEGACVSALNPHGERRLGTVGLRLPYQAIGIWKVDGAGHATTPCASGEIGVIGIHGPNVFPGYLREQDNRDIWLKPGWLNTGDLGYLDADGYLHLTGRAKELIIRGGHNIDPAMIEDALLRHPDVAIAAVVGQPNAHAGELPVAYVSLKPGSASPANELLAAAAKLIPERAAVPARIEILQEMPLTSIGKVARAELRLRAAEQVFQECLAQAGITASVRVRPDIRRGTVTFIQCAAADEACVQDVLDGSVPARLRSARLMLLVEEPAHEHNIARAGRYPAGWPGSVGATAANLLGRYGIRTLAIEKATEIFTAPRAIALDNEALRILQMAGLEEGHSKRWPLPKCRCIRRYSANMRGPTRPALSTATRAWSRSTSPILSAPYESD